MWVSSINLHKHIFFAWPLKPWKAGWEKLKSKHKKKIEVKLKVWKRASERKKCSLPTVEIANSHTIIDLIAAHSLSMMQERKFDPIQLLNTHHMFHINFFFAARIVDLAGLFSFLLSIARSIMDVRVGRVKDEKYHVETCSQQTFEGSQTHSQSLSH
jgi:hypothetical protein